tara:strand:+ start:313 stop:783 length:471 start_codon:yes stop_codon:yes gene_type:complete
MNLIKSWKARWPHKKLVVTNGCFDILHVGHVKYLQKAREFGDALLVGLNGDDSVRELKGSNRPINNQEDRAEVLRALSCVDFVHIFEDTRATNFLKEFKPDIYAKAGDYTLETLYPPERCALELMGSKIVFLPFIEGKSTTNILKKSMRRKERGLI